MQGIEVLKPESIDEALSLLEEHKDKIKILAGGTDLAVQLKEKHRKCKIMLDISGLKQLIGITEIDSSVEIMPLTSITTIHTSDTIHNSLPALRSGARLFGSPQIRNMATIGGNIVNASPVADTVPALILYNAKLHLKSFNNERTVSISDFAVGPQKTIIQQNELLTKITCDKCDDHNIHFYSKISPRKELTISKASVALSGIIDNYRFLKVGISLGSVAPKVIRGLKTEYFLIENDLTIDNLYKAAEILSTEATPITDVRSTKEYRQNVVGQSLIKELMFYAKK